MSRHDQGGAGAADKKSVTGGGGEREEGARDNTQDGEEYRRGGGGGRAGRRRKITVSGDTVGENGENEERWLTQVVRRLETDAYKRERPRFMDFKANSWPGFVHRIILALPVQLIRAVGEYVHLNPVSFFLPFFFPGFSVTASCKSLFSNLFYIRCKIISFCFLKHSFFKIMI